MQAKLLVAGKRSGKALVVGRQDLLQALSASSALAVAFDGVFVGRTGLAEYLRLARQGASVIKLVPEDSRLKVIFGSLGVGQINSGRWVPETRRVEAQLSALQVMVSPRGRYVPNVGAGDLADAFAKALATTFATSTDARPIALIGRGDTLTVRATDGTILFDATVPAAGVEGKAVVIRSEMNELAKALKRARRAHIDLRHVQREQAIGGHTVRAESGKVVCLAGPYELETSELVPIGPLFDDENIERILGVEAKASAFIGPKEFGDLLRAVWLLAGGEGKERTWAPIRIVIRRDKVVLESDGTQEAHAELEAQAKGNCEFRCNATVLLRALKAFGGEPMDLIIGSQEQPLVFKTEDVTVGVQGFKPTKSAAQPQESPVSKQEEKQEVAAQVAEDIEAIEEAEAEVEAEEAELAEAAEEAEEVELAPVN